MNVIKVCKTSADIHNHQRKETFFVTLGVRLK
jgi:hypothetical protein